MTLKEELIGRARELAPLVAQQSSTTEQQRAVPSALIQQFCDAGFMKIFVPKRYGGYELTCDVMTAVVSEIAPSCTSTAWVLAFYIGHNWLHCLFPEKSQEEVFRDRPYVLTPGTSAPYFTLTPTKGGFIAKGRSSWNSGSSRADWFLCGGLVKGDGMPPQHRLFLVPAKDATVVDNWDVAGMKGTSSNDLSIDGAFVPEYHTADAAEFLSGSAPGAAVHKNPLYSIPVLPFILNEVIPVMVGAYRGATNEFRNLTEARAASGPAGKTGMKQMGQIRIAKGLAGVALAEGMQTDYVNMLSNTDPIKLRDPVVRASIKARAALITDYCANGINELMSGVAAGAYRNTSTLQRYFRDINMVRVHAYLDLESACETYGRVLYGLPPEAPI